MANAAQPAAQAAANVLNPAPAQPAAQAAANVLNPAPAQPAAQAAAVNVAQAVANVAPPAPAQPAAQAVANAAPTIKSCKALIADCEKMVRLETGSLRRLSTELETFEESVIEKQWEKFNERVSQRLAKQLTVLQKLRNCMDEIESLPSRTKSDREKKTILLGEVADIAGSFEDIAAKCQFENMRRLIKVGASTGREISIQTSPPKPAPPVDSVAKRIWNTTSRITLVASMATAITSVVNIAKDTLPAVGLFSSAAWAIPNAMRALYSGNKKIALLYVGLGVAMAVPHLYVTGWLDSFSRGLQRIEL